MISNNKTIIKCYYKIARFQFIKGTLTSYLVNNNDNNNNNNNNNNDINNNNKNNNNKINNNNNNNNIFTSKVMTNNF